MRKIYIFVLIFSLCETNLYSQKSMISGTIINENGIGIPFAVVINKTANKGALCDSLGQFVLNARTGDSLSISCIGYLSKKYLIESLNTPYLLSLLIKADTLKEVRVLAVQNKYKERIGIQKGMKISKNFYFLPSESFLHAVCFDDENIKNKSIYSLNIKMGYKGNNKYLPVRINLYATSNNGFPNSKIGSKDLIINVTKYKWYQIVIDTELIIPENGICIGFEPLSPSTNLEKFNKNNSPIMGVYNSKEYESFSLTNYTRWYKFEKGQSTCPAIYLEVY